MKLKNLMSSISKASPLAGPLRMMYGRLQAQDNANATYNAVIPILNDALRRGYRFESEEVQAIVELLRELAPAGARRHNFERLYLKDEYSLKKLPRDARSLPYGHWH